jgi:cell division protein FtsI/penicillin-binding protein 2
MVFHKIVRTGTNSLFVLLGLFVIFAVLYCPVHGVAQASVKENQSRLSSRLHQDAAIAILDLSRGKTIFIQKGELINGARLPLGSLIKPFTLYLALARGEVNEDTVFQCSPSSIEAPESTRCWYTPGHGRISAARALAYSCNNYFRRVAARLDYQRFIAFLDSFGFDIQNLTDIRSPLERRMIMTGISNRLRETPINICLQLTALLRYGSLLKLDNDGSLAVSRVIELHEKYTGIIKRGMSLSRISGTSSSETGGGFGLSIWSKTGTAGIDTNDGEGLRTRYGFFYALIKSGDEEAAIIIVLPGGTGHEAAGIFDQVETYLETIFSRR